jgi:hypothetical protein
MTRHLLALILTAFLSITACGTTEERADQPQQLAPPRASTDVVAPTNGASVELIQPSDRSTLPPGAVRIVANVTAFAVVAKQFHPAVDGEGHVHFYLDVEKLPTTHAPPATGVYRSVSRTTYTWPNVPPGVHVFSVQLVGNDHVPLDPPAIDEVRVTVT